MKNNIKKIIEAKGLKIGYVIDKVGISRSAFYSIMNGESIPKLPTVRKICSVLQEDSIEDVFPNDKIIE